MDTSTGRRSSHVWTSALQALAAIGGQKIFSTLLAVNTWILTKSTFQSNMTRQFCHQAVQTVVAVGRWNCRKFAIWRSLIQADTACWGVILYAYPSTCCQSAVTRKAWSLQQSPVQRYCADYMTIKIVNNNRNVLYKDLFIYTSHIYVDVYCGMWTFLPMWMFLPWPYFSTYVDIFTMDFSFL